ncbi:MAG: hypothetical protein ABS87_08880 [Sphingomonas sp. SCN 67-18]|uniref:M56 family metallopeptidase n=1 Tax=uncultured Sphingomonas sp. TaxID=158754 RepID=UPI00086A8F39|nr:M56 family metallopeptidase [Sphingomonas sp. SCN 67-18]ODU20803.1 MAG: hypothetical protein ABS87_08880 [Sphingomonas sp. SCN 67-18]
MTGWIVETLVASSLLMLFVLAARRPVAAAFGPRAAYLLWLLPAARMVLPPLPDLGTPGIAALPVVIDLSGIGRAAHPVMAAPAAVESMVDWGLLALLIWVAGAIAYFGWHLLQYRRLMRDVLAKATPLPALDGPGVEVCASPLARGPFAAGIFIKTVVLPQDYRTRYEAGELALAMRHEMTHHGRCDISANLAALAILSLHWFNPLAHRAYRAFRIDQELACDAIVLTGAGAGERQAYASALVKSACDRVPAAACAIGAKDQLKRRLKMMGAGERTATRTRLGALMVGAVVLGGLTLTASGGIAAETTKKVEKQVRVKIIKQDQAVADARDAEDAAAEAASAAAEAAADAAEAAADATEQAAAAAAQAAEQAEAPQPPQEAEKTIRTVRIVHSGRDPDSAIASAVAAIKGINFDGISRDALKDAGCGTADVNVSADAQAGAGANRTRRTHVMVCGGKGVDAAQIRSSLIEGLTEAKADIADETDLSADQRSRIVAALEAKIAELRSRK